MGNLEVFENPVRGFKRLQVIFFVKIAYLVVYLVYLLFFSNINLIWFILLIQSTIIFACLAIFSWKGSETEGWEDLKRFGFLHLLCFVINVASTFFIYTVGYMVPHSILNLLQYLSQSISSVVIIFLQIIAWFVIRTPFMMISARIEKKVGVNAAMLSIVGLFLMLPGNMIFTIIIILESIIEDISGYIFLLNQILYVNIFLFNLIPNCIILIASVLVVNDFKVITRYYTI